MAIGDALGNNDLVEPVCRGGEHLDTGFTGDVRHSFVSTVTHATILPEPHSNSQRSSIVAVKSGITSPVLAWTLPDRKLL